MNIHIAIFKWKPDVTEANINAALSDVAALESIIPGIVDICCGKNTSPYAEGYTHVVLVRGENAASIDAYRKHPHHVAVAHRIEAMEEHGIGVDFSR